MLKQVTTLEDLDAELLAVDAAAAISDDELRKALQSFEFKIDQNHAGLDPGSEEYRRRQFEIYCHIAGLNAYDLKNERSHINVNDGLRIPFPYYTHSAQTVGDHLIAMGFIIKTMNLPAGASILEFGPGWGNTTINLARMGYSVTAVDIEPNFIELIRRRAAALELPVRTFCANFGIPPGCEGEQFDAVLFFESFHHCGDHVKLIRELDRILRDDGIAVFAAEPITDAFPLPWGVRTDGMSAWSIRRFKWLELGFQESYWRRLMQEHGWAIEKYVCTDTTIGTIFKARRARNIPAQPDTARPVTAATPPAPSGVHSLAAVFRSRISRLCQRSASVKKG